MCSGYESVQNSHKGPTQLNNFASFPNGMSEKNKFIDHTLTAPVLGEQAYCPGVFVAKQRRVTSDSRPTTLLWMADSLAMVGFNAQNIISSMWLALCIISWVKAPRAKHYGRHLQTVF